MARETGFRPPEVALAVTATADEIIAGLSRLDPHNRRSSASNPVFFALGGVQEGSVPALYVGMSPNTRSWLVENAGPAFVRARESELSSWATASALPEDSVDQFLAALQVIAAHDSSARLMVMPLGVGAGSGSGVAWSHDPLTGDERLTGRFRPDATGTDLVLHGGTDLAAAAAGKAWAGELATVVRSAYRCEGRPVEVEFVVERDQLWIIAERVMRLSGPALVRHTHQSTESAAEVLSTLTVDDIADALVSRIDTQSLAVVANGVGVSPGFATGVAVFRPEEALARQDSGTAVVLILRESQPEDLTAILAASGVITQRGGRSSHAAVVARSVGKPGITALADAVVDESTGELRLSDGTLLRSGTVITMDGTGGNVYLGAPAASPSGPDPAGLAVFDRIRDLETPVGVMVNADSAAEAAVGRAAGATGVGLCRIEHMFLGERKAVLEQALLAPRGPDVREAAHELHRIVCDEVFSLLSGMDGLPVVIRLLDPPRHEFVGAPETVHDESGSDSHAEAAVVARNAWRARLREHNPMLGVRGIRLGVLMPGLLSAQLRAVMEAVARLRFAGADPRPRLLVPMVSTTSELDFVREACAGVADSLGLAESIPCGVMIETPRAALLAGALAARCDFLSLGTNDLSALVWGLSRDDAETELIPHYQNIGMMGASPFAQLDVEGVGHLIRYAVDAARAVKPDIEVGVCGEHAADPESLRFFAECGVDYVSCAPPAVSLARYAALRMTLE